MPPRDAVQHCAMVLLLSTVAFAQPESHTIGAIFALSGNGSTYGTWAKNGIDLAVDEVNRSGGVNGSPLRVVFEDSQGLPAPAVSAYKKLTALDRVGFVLTGQSSVALAIAPLANKEAVIQVDIAATTPAYSSVDDFTFRTGIVATALASASAKELWERFKVEEVAILYIENDFGEGMRKAFRSAYQGGIRLELAFSPDATDYRATLFKLKQTNVSAVWLVSHIKESGVVLKQMREIGINAQVYSDTYSVEAQDFLTGAGAAAEGVIFLAPEFDSQSTLGTRGAFNAAYRKRYSTPPVAYAAQAYDGVLALAEGMKACEVVAPECVRQKLNAVNIEGASGTIAFDRMGDVEKSVVLRQVRNGEFVPY